MPIAIIGGTGFSQMPGLDLEARQISTDLGTAAAFVGSIGGKDIVFLPRHGMERRLAPHEIDYRANIAALRAADCTHILATNAVGGIREDVEPKHLVIPDQFIDFTKRHPVALTHGDEAIPHVDVTNPYCDYLRGLIAEAAWQRGLVVHQDVVYICTEGPRFETAAEIQMFAQLGGDVVGMTGVPEVILAREAGICYASVGIVTNYAAGIADEPLSADQVHEMMDEMRADLFELITQVIEALDTEAECLCFD